MRVADRGQLSRNFDEFSSIQRRQDSGAINSAQGFDLSPSHGLPIRDQRERLEGSARESCLTVETEKAANIWGKPGCRRDVGGSPVLNNDPAPRRIVVQCS